MKGKMKGKEFDILSEITKGDIREVYRRLEGIIAKEEFNLQMGKFESEEHFINDKKRMTSVKKISHYLRDLLYYNKKFPPLKETFRKSLNA